MSECNSVKSVNISGVWAIKQNLDHVKSMKLKTILAQKFKKEK